MWYSCPFWSRTLHPASLPTVNVYVHLCPLLRRKGPVARALGSPCTEGAMVSATVLSSQSWWGNVFLLSSVPILLPVPFPAFMWPRLTGGSTLSSVRSWRLVWCPFHPFLLLPSAHHCQVLTICRISIIHSKCAWELIHRCMKISVLLCVSSWSSKFEGLMLVTDGLHS